MKIIIFKTINKCFRNRKYFSNGCRFQTKQRR